MTALLTADEAAALRVGVNVIVRPGDMPDDLGARTRQRMYEERIPVGMFDNVHQITDPPGRVAPLDWVALTGPCSDTIDGEPESDWSKIEGFTIRRKNWDCRDGRRIEPLYTECPKCHPFNGDPADGGRCQTCGIKYHCYRCNHPCNLMATGHGEGKCENHDGLLLVGRGSIEAVPVVKHRYGAWRDRKDGETWINLYDEREATGYLDQLEFGGTIPARAIMFTMRQGILDRTDLHLDPLPVPGRDFGIVIDCVEVA